MTSLTKTTYKSVPSTNLTKITFYNFKAKINNPELDIPLENWLATFEDLRVDAILLYDDYILAEEIKNTINSIESKINGKNSVAFLNAN